MTVLRIDGEIELRRLQESMAHAIFRLVEPNRTHLREWLPWVDATRSQADVLQFIRKVDAQHAANLGFAAAIYWRGALCGCIGFHAIDWPNRAVALGYWLAAGAQGRGVMTRATSAMTDYAFRQYGLNRVEIRCGTGNQRSCAVPRRLGFVHEGVIRQGQWVNDRFLDLAVYSMLAADWSRGLDKLGA